MPLDLGDLACRFLLFPERRNHAIVDVGQANWIVESFVSHLEVVFSNSRIDDIGAIVGTFFLQFPRFTDWVRVSLDLADTAIVFHDNAPHVKADTFTRWRRQTSRLDPDSLVLSEFGRQFGRPPEQADLHGWGVLVTSNDGELRKIIDSTCDIHTHFEGCECASALWVDFLRDQDSLYRLRYYADTLRLNRPDTAPEGIRDHQFAASVSAREAWLDLAGGPTRQPCSDCGGSIGGRDPHNLPQLDDRAGNHLSPVSRYLWHERKVLGHAWAQLWLNWDEGLAEKLDAVLYGKSLFLATQQQFSGGNPGLANFRRYFDRMKPLRRPEGWKNLRDRWNRMLSFAVESPLLERIELRIAPLPSVAEYREFFMLWERFFRENKFFRTLGRFGRPSQEMFTFIVHFIRWPEEAESDFSNEPFFQLRSELDQMSAALHLFRLQEPILARHIKGIDVANKERSCPVDLFSPYIRLLRGVYPEDNLKEDIRSPYLERWRGIVDARRHLSSCLGVLGLTYHAGEDYFHIIDGLRTMWNAIEGADMQAGDRIGHGLAAGADIDEFNRSFASSGIIPGGELLDGLTWLYGRLVSRAGHDAMLRRIHDEIEGLAMEIYGKPYSPAELGKAKALRHRPPRVGDRQRMSVIQRIEDILDGEMRHQDVRSRRRELRKFPPLLRELADELRIAQVIMIQFNKPRTG